MEKMKESFKDKDALKDNGEFEVFKGKTYTNRARIWFRRAPRRRSCGKR